MRKKSKKRVASLSLVDKVLLFTNTHKTALELGMVFVGLVIFYFVTK